MVSLHLPQNGLNIDRSSLPQVKSTDVQDYIHWLSTHKHFSSSHLTLPVSQLRPSQGNFNTHKIHEFMGKERDELRKPIIVSSDHYVIDGHHRWIALMNMDKHDTVPVIMVNAKIQDLLAATHEYPKSFTKSVVESFASMMKPANPAVLAYCRMNPPTAGHEKLINKVHEIAEDLGAHHEVVLSPTQDAVNNPLSQEKRLGYAMMFFPETNFVAATIELPSLLYHAARLYKAGHDELVVVAGDDRIVEFDSILHKYNGQFDEQGNGYFFKKVHVVSSGPRDNNAISSSILRSQAAVGDFTGFSQGVPTTATPEDVQAMYDDVRLGQGALNESHEFLSEGVHDAGIFKAVFITGAPGSGKDFVMKKSLHGHGLIEVDSDTALEYLMDKAKLDLKMPEHEQEKRNVVRDRAKSLTELRQRLAVHGRNGLIINSTGAKSETIKKTKKMLDELGYDSKMVFVDTSDNVSRNRNVERGQRGGRMIPEKLRAEKWRQAQDSRVEFAKMFGGEHYHEFNNDEDLRTQADPEVAGQKHKELEGLFKTVKKFTQEMPKAPQAHEWIHKNLGKLAKQPVGNKQQQSSQVAPSKDSQASEEARKLGLQYYGHGRYGKSGRVSHFSLSGRLVEKEKAMKTTAPKPEPKITTQKPAQAPTKKPLSEAFEELLMEDSNVDLRLDNYLESDVLVGEPEGQDRGVQHFSEAKDRFTSGYIRPDKIRDLSEYPDGNPGIDSMQERVSFENFRARTNKTSVNEIAVFAQTLGTTQGDEPQGSSIGLGQGKEEIISTDGKASSGPARKLQSFKKSPGKPRGEGY